MSNNVFFDCPAHMSDRRIHMMIPKDNDYLNIDIINKNNIKNSYDYKLFLQQKNPESQVTEVTADNNNELENNMHLNKNVLFPKEKYKNIYKFNIYFRLFN